MKPQKFKKKNPKLSKIIPLEETSFLKDHKNQDNAYIASFDEVGRGSVFGPVAVGGVLFPVQSIYKFSRWPWHNQVKDSKLLSEIQREDLFQKIESSFTVGVAYTAVHYIDRFNINTAIQAGIYRLIQKFNRLLLRQGKERRLMLALIDGNYRFIFPKLNMKSPVPELKSIIKGDQRLFTISCASIIAKVSRDRLLKRASKRYPEYLIHKNKGYGTKEHMNAIQDYGLTKLHRKSFLKKYISLTEGFNEQ